MAAFDDIAWMAGAAHAGQAASYGITSCSAEKIRGYQSEEVSAVGLAERILQPREWEIYERFVTVADGPSASGPIDLVLAVRDQLWGEPWARVTGRLVPGDGGQLGDMVLGATLPLVGRGRALAAVELRWAWRGR